MSPFPVRWLLLLFGLVAVVFTLPLYRHWGNWGIQDWDMNTFHAAAQRAALVDYRQAPLWNPWFAGGMPMLGRPESNWLSPVFGVVLALGALSGFKVLAGLHLWIGLAGAYALGRGMALSRTGAVLMAVVFMLGGTYAVHMAAGNAWAFNLAWIPWAVVSWHRALRAAGASRPMAETGYRAPETGAGAAGGGGKVRSPRAEPLQGGSPGTHVVQGAVGAALARTSLSEPPGGQSPASRYPCLSPDALLCSVFLLLMWFGGGPYPMVLTLFFMGALWAGGSLAGELRPWPALRTLLIIGVLTIVLGAIKFLPVMELSLAYPRVQNLHTGFSLQSLAAGLFGRDQSLSALKGTPDAVGFLRGVSQSMNETGTYVGLLPVLLFVVGALTRWRGRVGWLIGLGLMVWLAFGVRAPASLWHVLHRVPVFNIMRVAERFRYFMVLELALFAGLGLDVLRGLLARRGASPRVQAMGAGMVVAVVLLDVWLVVRPVYEEAFTIRPLAVEKVPGAGPIVQTRQIFAIGSNGWAKAGEDPTHCTWSSHYPAFLAGQGIVEAYEEMPVPRKAIPVEASSYRGEVWVEGVTGHGEPGTGNGGKASYRVWSPNRLVIEVSTAEPGRVVVNQNFYPGWRAGDGRLVEAAGGLIAVKVTPADREVELFYRPTSFVVGAWVSGVSWLAVGVWGWRRRGRNLKAWGED